jgi:uncharacterized protein (TIGR02996 family)
MTDDLRALLAATVADPADDTIRLAYADCLEEHGNAARAAFIRLQIEAERHHPDSATRAALEAQTQALFADHWIDWWGEVCGEVGLPWPAPKPASALGRIARGVGLGKRPGTPYEPSGFAIRQRSRQRIGGWVSTTFRRGFPEAVEIAVPFPRYENIRYTLGLWPPVSPLSSLRVYGPLLSIVAGPHFDQVRTLELIDHDAAEARSLLASPQFAPRLKNLTLLSGEFADDQGVVEEFADQVGDEVMALRGRRLTRLALQVWTDAAAHAVANAPHLTSLTALEVDILPDSSEDSAGAGRRLTMLARSPHLAGLRELKVVGGLDAAGIEAVIRNPTWTGLRKLELDAHFWYESFAPFFWPTTLGELEEFRLAGVRLTVGLVQALAAWPPVKRVRHFALRGQYGGGVRPSELMDVVDPDRIETFALRMPELPASLVEALRNRFGERFRFLA